MSGKNILETLIMNRNHIMSAVIISMLLITSIGMIASEDSAADPVAGATGTPDTNWYTANPSATTFAISTADQLAGLSILTNPTLSPTYIAPITDFDGRTITLTDNIDISIYCETGTGWAPIGYYANFPFKGTFDGNGKTITGLSINEVNDTTGGYKGLFSSISGGTVKGLGVEVDIAASFYVGGIAGVVFNNGKIENCHVSGTIAGGKSVGGIAGYVGGYVFSGSTMFADGGTVINSYTTCDINAAGTSSSYVGVGGIAGYVARGGIVENCYTSGEITMSATVDAVGGIAGNLDSNGIIRNCYSLGNVKGASYVGGIVGSIDSRDGNGGSKLTSCYSIGKVDGDGQVGGIVGIVWSSSTTSSVTTVSNCAALNSSIVHKGNTMNHQFAGRIVGNGIVTTATYTNNVAWTGISLGAYVMQGSGPNGTDITAAKINSDGKINGLFSGSPWTTKAGKLPGLFGTTVDMPAHLVSTATPEEPTYTVTVTGGTASVASGKTGTKVTLTPNAPAGKQIKDWTVVSGGVTVTNNSFTIGSADVVLEAVWWNSYSVKTVVGNEFKKGEASECVITIDMDVSRFKNVSVDGQIISQTNYTVESGSTIVTLNAEYLSTLSAGNHTVDVMFDDGAASTTLKITGDGMDMTIIAIIAVVVVVAIVLVYFLFIRKP